MNKDAGLERDEGNDERDGKMNKETGGREKTAATETPRRAINKFDTRVGKLAKLPASGVSI